jgi:uncharacterized membrane protein (DUF4010 family)
VPPEYIDIAYALGIGVLIGLERQHREVSREDGPPEEGTAIGVRTFALLALLGWLARYLSEDLPWLPLGVIALVGVLVVSQHLVFRHERSGITTEIAATLTLVLGMLVASNRLLAATLAILATVLLISKPFVGVIVSKLRRVELTGTLQLLIAVAIILPLLPAEPADPWGALPPQAIGLFVVLIAGLSYVGYFLSRILGKHRGVGVTGLVGGITSSTAVTATMAQTASKDPSMRESGQLAVFVANTMVFGRVLIITAAVSRDTAMAIVWPMVAMALVMLVASVWSLPALRARGKEETEGPELKNPFALLPALKFGLVLSVVLLIATTAADTFGSQGLVVVAALSGLADVDPITLAAARQANAGDVTISLAALAITIAVIANFVVKGGIAIIGGGRAFGDRIVLVFALASVAGVAAALLT